VGRAGEIRGDKDIPSSHPEMQKVNPIVHDLQLEFPAERP
jgi:hypothetical protein